ncbi:hypothetical protein CCS01_20285 [Rhodopila globiformis]|uniref:Transposase IS701-like DDE domain-containing protein n=2 Tax=Rhodopila globiformis TaxID=1071 RepID=A0A2S6N5Q1_RHOGL|nr:hypothetical protein CCS01_20285 [Rhodopila globiformis]
MRLIARWLPHRRLVMVGDGAFASLTIFQKLKDRAVCVARCRMDARFFNPPRPRKDRQKGRSRVLGTRQLTPKTRAFVCSDPARTALEILTWYAMRWATLSKVPRAFARGMAAEGVEVTVAETRRHLGIETQRQWSDLAIQRTTPLLLGLFSLVTLWAGDLAARAGKLPVLGAAWYKNPDPTFADALAVVRQRLCAEEAVRPILWRDDYPTWRSRPRTAQKPRPISERLAELMAYAA